LENITPKLIVMAIFLLFWLLLWFHLAVQLLHQNILLMVSTNSAYDWAVEFLLNTYFNLSWVIKWHSHGVQ